MGNQKEIMEKTSSDCFDLQICPYSVEVANELGLDCGQICKNCRFCPVTCGHREDIVSMPFMNCEDGGVDCVGYQPNRIVVYENTLDNIEGMFWGYDEHGWYNLAPEKILERIRETIKKADRRLLKKKGETK